MLEFERIMGVLQPWEFSLSWSAACLLAAGLYLRGLQRHRRQAAGTWRALAYLLGVGAIYAVTQTHFDYLSQYMFFIHRAQHLVLHHAAPFLIALAAPLPVLAAGMPNRLRHLPGRAAAARLLRPIYRLLQHPAVAPLLFVGLIYFWLIPEVHFDAMLSRQRYQVMNWSMLLDGLLFWWLVLDPRTPRQGGLGYGMRILALLLVIPPQILLGAYLTFSENVLFDVYAVCGRAWPIAPLTDQQLGGLITWIPASMMSVAGVLIVIRAILSGKGDARPGQPEQPEGVPQP
ncbi:cytochrome c oxidase assembly protein [Halomonas sp. MCCC 1A17488]|uniref:Cytochrome c oxidase assembly protein n=1 Tax=Billgrantia sulfidoxydans TaxID=2733484 RepID=A0ABX7W1C3_9GAMM|nr:MULTISPECIES: cytochrome c oxidase assembly protein [Halomonas]MCE8016374.1 cytochrome c oxidase assembly protein [Halomonas sp. MCCC 1A17488]MCG3239707.1 cytochrome c oxidase assembly protein [Halomonas sp. MCCC 1A17488]QPP50384.1 cytochrome c oxidase assembly protein [Halomonas sp. SS10-MC5]QTP54003.1 cytochrome c oxidase assembly protein [Halomonas sulfidoxydans]